MLTYKAAYRAVQGGIHAEILDFPGVISSGANMEEARRQLAEALADMAETNLLRGEALSLPDATRTDPDADVEEPVHLLLQGATRVAMVAQEATP